MKIRKTKLRMEQLEVRLPLANSAQVFDSGIFALPGSSESLQTVQVRRIGEIDSEDPTTLVGFVVEDSTGSLDSLPFDESYSTRALARARDRFVYFGNESVEYRSKGGSLLSFGVIGESSVGDWISVHLVDSSDSDIGFLFPVENHDPATVVPQGNGTWQLEWDFAGTKYTYEVSLELGASVTVESFVNSDSADVAPGPTLVEGDFVSLNYAVSNPGSTALDNVVVRDDNGTPDDPSDDFDATPSNVSDGVNVGDVNTDGLLDPGETWIFNAVHTALLGQFSSVATVTADAAGESITACDAANYLGDAMPRPDVALTSFLTSPEPLLPAGNGVFPRYLVNVQYEFRPVVRNSGELPVSGPFEVQLDYRDTTSVVSAEGALEPGAELTLDPLLFMETELGTFDAEFTLDPRNLIDEGDESASSNQISTQFEMFIRRRG